MNTPARCARCDRVLVRRRETGYVVVRPATIQVIAPDLQRARLRCHCGAIRWVWLRADPPGDGAGVLRFGLIETR